MQIFCFAFLSHFSPKQHSRYDDGPPPQLAVSRPRVCVLLHRWIDNFWNDFSSSAEGVNRRAQLDAFIANRIAATLPASAESLKQLIAKVMLIHLLIFLIQQNSVA